MSLDRSLDPSLAQGVAEQLHLSSFPDSPIAQATPLHDAITPDAPQLELRDAAGVGIGTGAGGRFELVDRPQYFVFLFVNPTSGGSKAGEITQLGVETFRFHAPYDMMAYVYDITSGDPGNKPGFKRLKTVVDGVPADQIVRVVVAGGDGTVMWCLSELEEHGIDVMRVAIGVVPYGTGNDFARALAWSRISNCALFDASFALFKALVHTWIESRVVPYDIWEVEVSVQDDGCFKKIDSKTRQKKTLTQRDDASRPVVSQKFPMANYFSTGIESRIGLGFDRHRARSPFANKVVYFTEGLKKAFKKTPRITDVISNLSEVSGESGPSQESPLARSEPASTSSERSVFSLSTSSGGPKLVGKPASLIAINIPSFAGGLDIWRSSKGRPGLRQAAFNQDEILKSPQAVGDGKIEWMTFDSSVAIGAEKVISGHGRRVYQGSGPFKLTFKDRLPGGEGRFYMQVDGEFFQLCKPKEALLRHHKTIQVLMADQKVLARRIKEAKHGVHRRTAP
ncbi:unnamed protein product [Vitrella brassicaformis CCMP3155]|uniref:Diacylglycerol kinase n=2 Tax=Vitrella brassicaformis TaxID=1169539 RepID=A0A0G4EF06_VITBC|nr:unnamed protein product [Vitrella brassicaformis CCMP3155]|mmetsp:Transcript_49663/g.124577  ORF Transcript_49663/g.124577 Transcript_49663/m.124577 type:complete len:509 (+) Transcript_49663:136-1662(+)|eukprot:CEL94293.1 unnamed protein product [Vitrella brassicaformis CCMP3155]